MSVVDVCRGSLVRAKVGARRGTEAILLHILRSLLRSRCKGNTDKTSRLSGHYGHCSFKK